MAYPENRRRYCPDCDKEIHPSCAMIFDFINVTLSCARFDALYFLCGECRLACIDKAIIREDVSSWRKWNLKSKSQKKLLPHRVMCKKIVEILEKNLEEHFIPYLGYERIKHFNKTPRK